MYLNKLLIYIVGTALLACKPIYGYEYEKGELPDFPVNLSDFNSKYDDYNATAPSLGQLIPFCFSTNRNSQGNTFDVRYEPMNVNFDKSTGVLKVSNEYDNWSIYQERYGVIYRGVREINTTANEFGPYLLSNLHEDFSDFDFLLMYATDVEGNFQIHYNYAQDDSEFLESKPIPFLNSDFDDLYPSFNADFSRIYFCSNRLQGNFNIFQVTLDRSGDQLITSLSGENQLEVTLEDILSSDGDDKCPYVFENTLVFTSNRPGGLGGYDLYYSKLEDGNWTTPINFGPGINSEYDEFRPILFEEGVDYEKSMMVFSSNRPGGKGGFDLYFVGV